MASSGTVRLQIYVPTYCITVSSLVMFLGRFYWITGSGLTHHSTLCRCTIHARDTIRAGRAGISGRFFLHLQGCPCVFASSRLCVFVSFQLFSTFLLNFCPATSPTPYTLVGRRNQKIITHQFCLLVRFTEYRRNGCTQGFCSNPLSKCTFSVENLMQVFRTLRASSSHIRLESSTSGFLATYISWIVKE